VVVALSMMVITFFAALAIDLGFLTLEKDSLQNKVEAAVESGVRVLHQDASFPYSTAFSACLDSLEANQETVTPETFSSHYQPGFYDYKDDYPDFEQHKNFVSEQSGEMPPGENPNAIAIIGLMKNVETIEVKPSGSNTGRVTASAVAYGKNYTFLALDNASDAVRWGGHYSANHFFAFRNCLIGSGGGIIFHGDEAYDRTLIEAAGPVSTYSGDPPPEYREINSIHVPPIDWDKLRHDAQMNGKVYNPQTWTSEWQSDEYGNFFRRVDLVVPGGWSGPGYTYIRYIFLPRGEDVDGIYSTSGDHQGRTYYFDAPDPASIGADRVILYFLNDDAPGVLPDLGPFKRRFWNCTLAAPCEMSTYPFLSAVYGYGGHPIYFGNYETYGNEGLVYMYCENFGRDSNYSCWYTAYGGSPIIAEPHGVVIRTNGKFRMRSQSSPPVAYYLKVLADTIEIGHPYFPGETTTFVGGFGPSDVFQLGFLE